jgi:hypothetical protein
MIRPLDHPTWPLARGRRVGGVFEQPAELDARLLLGLGGGLEADRPPGKRIHPGVHGDPERAARKLLYVTLCNPWHDIRIVPSSDIRLRHFVLRGQAMAPFCCVAPLPAITASCQHTKSWSYTAATPVHGLAQADSALLAILIEEALTAEILFVSWPAARTKAEERGMTPSAIDEAFAALQNRHYLKIKSIAAGPYTVELSATAFQRGVDAVVPGAEAARRQVIAALVNDPPARCASWPR